MCFFKPHFQCFWNYTSAWASSRELAAATGDFRVQLLAKGSSFETNDLRMTGVFANLSVVFCKAVHTIKSASAPLPFCKLVGRVDFLIGFTNHWTNREQLVLRYLSQQPSCLTGNLKHSWVIINNISHVSPEVPPYCKGVGTECASVCMVCACVCGCGCPVMD